MDCPPTTRIPIERFVAAPAPLPSVSGIIPATRASVVIRIAPQSIAISLDDRVVAIQTTCTHRIRVIDLQNRVFLNDSKEQEDSEGGKDVQRLSCDRG